MKALKAVALVLVSALLLTGCEWSVYSVPLPGGPDTGDNPKTVSAKFEDVLDLVPQSLVKHNDVDVGKVTAVKLDGYDAEVTMAINNNVDIPGNVIANIRQTSLLGEKFVSLDVPNGAEPEGELADNAALDNVLANGRNAEVEEVFSALSLLLNGGGVAQLKTITTELNTAFEGRESTARSLLNQADKFVSVLDQNKGDIVDSIEALNKLAIEVNKQRSTIEAALDELPSAVKSINSQRGDLVKMLRALDKLSNVGVRVIKAAKASTVDALESLSPVLTKLGEAGPDLVNAFSSFYAFPFVDETVGRNPQVARNLQIGDYVNLSVKLDADLFGDLLPKLVCGQLSGNADLAELCGITLDALADCLGADGDLQSCLDLNNITEILEGLLSTNPLDVLTDLLSPEGIQDILESGTLGAFIPRTAAEAPEAPPGDNPLSGLTGSLQEPAPRTDTDTDGENPKPNTPDQNSTPQQDNDSFLGGLFSNEGGGLFRVSPELYPSGQGPTLAALRQAYDPELVDFLVPGMVAQ